MIYLKTLFSSSTLVATITTPVSINLITLFIGDAFRQRYSSAKRSFWESSLFEFKNQFNFL